MNNGAAASSPEFPLHRIRKLDNFILKKNKKHVVQMPTMTAAQEKEMVKYLNLAFISKVVINNEWHRAKVD